MNPFTFQNKLLPMTEFQYSAPDVNRLAAPIQQGMDAYQRQQNERFDQGIRSEQLALQRQASGRADESHAMAMEKQRVEQIAGLAQMADQEPDPARRQMIWGKIVASHPQFGAALQKHGIDPSDHVNGPKFIMSQARGYVDPLQEQLTQAKIAQAKRGDEPEIVRQLRAAGIPPESEEGRSLIRNSIKGGGPIDQAIAGAITGSIAPQQSAPRVMPQSYGDSQTPLPRNALAPMSTPDPNIIPVQAAEGRAAQPPMSQRPPEMVDTPIGRMPAENARTLGFGLAYQGKGEAGKMMLEATNAAKLGKESANENDKKELAATEGLARARQIAAGFKPEWLTYENKAKQYGVSWMDSFDATRKKIPPEMLKDHVDYTMFVRDAVSNLTQGIKDATGAAMGVQEEHRIRAGLPDPQKDNPTAFAAKLQGVVREMGRTVARTRYLRKEGFQGRPWTGDGYAAERDLPLAEFDKIIDRRGDQLMQQYRNQGAAPTEINGLVKQQLRLEFGIDS